MWKNQVI
jgi:hypothetical protein